MRRQHPDHRMDIPISLEVYHQLLGASTSTGFAKEDWEIAAEAIDEWTRRHNPESLTTTVASGYQWKRLFLQDGTLLRTVFGGKNYHCVVEGDRIVYDGKTVSPSGFVNAVGGIRRNAWLCTWILFPDSKQWQLADTLRADERKRRVRKPFLTSREGAAMQAPAVNPAVHVNVASGPINSAASMNTAAVTPCVASPHVQRPIHDPHDQAPKPIPGEDCNRRQHTGTTLPPHPSVRSSDRRSNGNDAVAALLRDELLPLLYQICAGDATISAHTGTASVASDRWNWRAVFSRLPTLATRTANKDAPGRANATINH